MSAADALELLLDPHARRRPGDRPRGAERRADARVLAGGHRDPARGVQAAAKDAASSGCPTTRRASSRGSCSRRRTRRAGHEPRCRCSPMVDRFEQAGEDVGLVEGAGALGNTPYEVVIVASLIEREVRKDDEYRKVARVVYNRLEQEIPLGIDATVLYARQDAPAARSRGRLPRTRRTRTAPPACRPRRSPRPARPRSRAALNPADGDTSLRARAKEGTTLLHRDYQEFLDQRDKSRAEGVFRPVARGGPGSPDRPLAVAAAAPRRLRRARAARGPTTRSSSTRPSCRASSTGSTPPGPACR